MPRGQIRMRLSKPGFQTIEVASAQPRQRYRLDPAGTVPPGMVRVAGGPLGSAGVAGTLEDFWIDRFEVTNEQFQLFVDRGRLPAARVVARAVRGRRSYRPVDRGHDAVSRSDGPARTGDVGGRSISGRTRNVPGRRRELVRSGGVRGLRRPEPADDAPLVSGGGAGPVRRHRGGQQLRRPRTSARRPPWRAGAVRHV